LSESDRVAVIVVHGIADQRPGQTVREISRLLCHGGEGAPRYVRGEMREVLVPVGKLEPGASDSPQSPPRKITGDLSKDDAARRRPGAPSGFFETQQFAAPLQAKAQISEPAARSGDDAQPQDLGMAMNDYLLKRLQLPEGDALYESTRVSLRRRADDRAVDVYELYWADLSRLGAGGIKALTALYQLFFHLGTLSADIVDHVALGAQRGRAWRFLQRMHAWMAWLMKGPMALLQLAMLMMVLFGTAALVSREVQPQLLAAFFGAGGLVLAALGVMAWLSGKSAVSRWAQLLISAIAAVASLVSAVYALSADRWLHFMYFGASALLTAMVGSWLIERYSGVTQGVRWLGHVLVLATILGLCVDGSILLERVTTQYEWMLTAALNVGEWLMAAALLAWAVFVVVQILALLLGLWLGREIDAAGKASLQTARLALVGSTGLFAVLSLVLWSVISFVVAHGLNDLLYEPMILGEGYRSGAIFLEARVQSLGAFFTPLVLAFTALTSAALLVLLPSLMEELKPTTNLDAKGLRYGAPDWSRRLGLWLGGGMRLLNGAVKYLIPAGAIVGSLLYLAFIIQQVAWASGAPASVETLSGWLEMLKGETLVDAGKWLAGGALTIVALGSRFTQTFGRLRVAIDAVLDIDSYFADPPNHRPPRARIFSRYASLLRYLRDHGYERIVIVSHSQGTVISADLLRYLHVQGRLRDFVGDIPVSLVTVGSPLRDLYAERFPLLYRWMGSNAGGFATATPGAADVGAVHWVNACRSGDYVGRFIWMPPGDAKRFRIAMVGLDGQLEAQRAGDRTEICLGAGGHTHYFSNDAVALAVEIDRLIAR
jgi:hypothetical protein